MQRSVIVFSCLVLTAVIAAFGFYSSNSNDFTGVPDGKNGSIVAQVDATPLWTAGANMTADATFGGGAAYTRNDTVWLHALSNSPASTQHLRYNAATNTWATMAPMLLVRDRFSCAVLGNNMYVLGGADAGSVYQTSVQVYDELANTWSNGPAMPVGLGWTKSVAYQDSLIYVAGGYNGTTVAATVYLFNKNSGTWRTASPLPQARFGGGFARSGDTLVYTCGIDAAGTTVVNTTFKGVISSSDRSVITWTTGAAAPFTVFRTDAASWGCKGIILYHGSPTTAFTGANNCASYSPGADAWTTLPNMPAAALYANTGSVRLSGNVWKLIVAGGYNSAYLRNTQILTDTLCPSVVGVQPVTNVVPQVYSIEQNYPNPFNPTTNIKFSIPKDGFVELKVYDILGSEVAALVSEQYEAGTYNVNFDASKLSSGVYFYSITSGDFRQTKKMLLVK